VERRGGGGNQRSFGASGQGREGDNDGCTARVTKEREGCEFASPTRTSCKVSATLVLRPDPGG
jgi:hypothetical protein